MNQRTAQSTAEVQAQSRILLSDQGEISKKDIRLIKQRFLNLNRLRLQRVQQALTPRQHIFLDLLPLLFHVNHPILPGYLSSKVPAGIPDYAPSKHTVSRAKSLGKGFVFRKRALRVYPIDGIYLMGSVGSVAHSSKSDLDIWLCHSTHLSDSAAYVLSEKARAIELWAEGLDLEVHFFLIDSEQFRQGAATPLSSESSGSTQHHLLLEEFYRTALYIAGRYPVWWLVPPKEESRYRSFVDHMIKLRFIDATEIIDFGGLEHVPPEEYLGASLWHLYKAIDSPYKSLLKLNLMETYVEQFPNCQWSCTRMKTAVYNGETDTNQLDAYVIMYRAIEQHLLKNAPPERLELMRYCFYNKVNESRPRASAYNADWRNEALQRIVDEWGELDGFLKVQMESKVHSIEQIQEERQRLTQELTHSYRLLTRFAHENVQMDVEDDEELRLLGRKLHAALEKKPGKIDRISTGHRQIQAEPNLLIRQMFIGEQESWTLFKQDINGNNKLLHRGHCVLDLLAWSFDTGIVNHKTSFALDPGTSQMSSREIQQILRDVQKFFLHQKGNAGQLEAFRQSAFVNHAYVFLNAGFDPLADLSEQGVHLTSERSDALSFGSRRQNLVHTADLLFGNTWNEVLVRRFVGIEGLFDALCLMLEPCLEQTTKQSPNITFKCHTSARANSIARRIQSLYNQASQVFSNTKASDQIPRFIVTVGKANYLLQYQRGQLRHWHAETQQDLEDELARPQTVFSPVVFDDQNHQDSPLASLYSYNKTDRVQLFYQMLEEQRARIFVLDERGSLHQRELQNVREDNLFMPYAELIEASWLRRLNQMGHQQPVNAELEFFRIEKTHESWIIHAAAAPQLHTFQKMAVRIVYDEPAKSHALYCNEREFSSLEYGTDVFKAAGQYIRQQRASQQDYPIYISDIDIPANLMGVDDAEQLQTVHFLRYKQKIEARLNPNA